MAISLPGMRSELHTKSLITSLSVPSLTVRM